MIKGYKSTSEKKQIILATVSQKSLVLPSEIRGEII